MMLPACPGQLSTNRPCVQSTSGPAFMVNVVKDSMVKSLKSFR